MFGLNESDVLRIVEQYNQKRGKDLESKLESSIKTDLRLELMQEAKNLEISAQKVANVMSRAENAVEIATEIESKAQTVMQSVERMVQVIERGEASRVKMMGEISTITLKNYEQGDKTFCEVKDALSKFVKLQEEQSQQQKQILMLLKTLADNFVSAVQIEEQEPAAAPEMQMVPSTTKKTGSRRKK